MIPTLIVDDEPLARKRMHALLRDYGDFVVVGEAADGEEALRAITALEPRVVFLDVEMPGFDGFEVVRRLESVQPLIVFVTAFEQYALDAFRASAVQYLLKPVDRDDLQKAIERLRQLVDDRSSMQRIAVKSRARTLLFRVEQIDWIESAGNYVRLHIGAERHLLRETMTALEQKLDPHDFARIHRTAIVNLARVRELQPTSHGEFVVVLEDGTRLTLSRVFRDRIEPLLGKL
jgi:two-component system LytT family response regulator